MHHRNYEYTIIKKKIEGIEINKLLQSINLRIEKLLDKDHSIGHSYFLDVKSVEDLKNSFREQIIPLLKEYFFGDYGKIGLVLGNAFIKEIQNEIEFAADFGYDVEMYDEKKVFQFKDVTKLSADDFIRIYKNV